MFFFFPNLRLKITVMGLWLSNICFKFSIIGFNIGHFKTHDITFKPKFEENYECHVHNKSTNLGL